MNDVSLREFIERIITENNLRRDDLRSEDRRWVERDFSALEKALKLQAAEYERRLEVLNHAHAEAHRVLGTYIPRELYERAHAEVVDWQHKADVRFSEVDARLKKVELGLVDLPGGVKSLELGLASQSARDLGSRMTMTTAITIIALAITAVGGMIALLNYLNK